jgi:hypothetical protein
MKLHTHSVKLCFDDAPRPFSVALQDLCAATVKRQPWPLTSQSMSNRQSDLHATGTAPHYGDTIGAARTLL